MMQKLTIFFIFLLLPFIIFSQHTIRDIKGITIISQKTNSDFKEYYEITVDQPLDHFNKTSQFFKQRFFVGLNNTDAPTVMETEGYAIGNTLLPSFMKGCNYIAVEHRYFGKSLPDSLDWTYLTIKQAAYDLHHIRELFDKIFKGSWMTTGISKGGQTAIAYKLFFPKDADATLAYVTPIKKSINDNRLADYIKSTYKTECGKKILSFQKFAFRNKSVLLKEFDKYVQEKGYHFGKMNNEMVFEYLLLEYSFAFYQNCFDCKLIPDTSALPTKIVEEVVSVVSPRFYSEAFRSKLEPSFYMFYHELGYYEYDLKPFKNWLSRDSYPNSIFTPKNVTIKFDATYLTSINKFISNPTTEKIIFIYGELDPYTSLKASTGSDKNCMIVIVKNGCHKSRIENLTEEQQENIVKQLSIWLKWTIEK